MGELTLGVCSVSNAPLRHQRALLQAEGALLHPDIHTATMEILPDGKSRAQIQSEIKAKERAQDVIARRFSNPRISRYVVFGMAHATTMSILAAAGTRARIYDEVPLVTPHSPSGVCAVQR